MSADREYERDDQGRFTSGGSTGAFVAKHTGQMPKLEGYSKPEGGGLDKWAGKVSGRARDIEIPLARKTEGHLATTGDRPLHEATGLTSENTSGFSDTMGHTLVEKTWTTNRVAATAAGKEVAANEREHTKLNKQMQKLSGEIKNLRIMVKSSPELQEKLDKTEAKMRKLDGDGGKLGKLLDKGGVLEVKQQNLEGRVHAADSARDSFRAMKSTFVDHLNENRAKNGGFDLAKHANNDATVNISHDPKDGSFEIHMKGNSHDEKFPGEKEMTVRIEPPTFKLDADKTMAEVDQPARYTITSQYPTDRRGKDHPSSAEHVIEGNEVKTGMLGAQPKEFNAKLQEHFKNFLNS